jgi:glucokinase
VGLTIGVDVGGTKIAGGLVDERGQVLAHERVESPATDPPAIVRRIADLVALLGDGRDVEAVGVSAAGFVDKQRATVVFAPNLAWRNEPLRDHLQEVIGLPVVVENDANAAAWGEFTFGAGTHVQDLLMVTVGTGVGGGIVVDGELMRGGFGMGAEIGHIRLVPDGVRCGCGNLGCLESYGSGSALVRTTRERVRTSPVTAANLLERAGGDPDRIDGPLITAAAKDGDLIAREQLAEVGTALGVGVASLVAVLDPNLVVVGGGVSEAGDLLLDPLRNAFASHVSGRGYRPLAEVHRSLLDNPGLIGAADLARRR